MSDYIVLLLETALEEAKRVSAPFREAEKKRPCAGLEAENARLRGELEEIEIRARMAQGWDDNLADEVRAYMLCDIMRHIEQHARCALQEGSDD